MNTKLSMEELNRMDPEEFRKSEKQPITVILENIRSGNNVGAVFRTCDAFRINKIILVGYTPKPPHREILKTALGATESVEWTHYEKTDEALEVMKKEGYKIAVCEQTRHSEELWNLGPQFFSKPIALVFGNEVRGVSEEAVEQADMCLEIPQMGTKHSLNISVSAGVVLWHLTYMQKAGKNSPTENR